MIFIRYLYSDFLKIKRRPVLWMHLLVPIAGVAFLLLTCVFSKASAASNPINCPGAIAVAFPMMIGIVCSMIAEQEAEAGNFQPLLMAPVKLLPFLSMLTLLLLLGLGAALLTVFGFEVSFAVILGKAPFGPEFYLRSVLLLFGCNLFLYFFHLVLSLRFNKGVSIGIGIVESLVSALLITGLGDGKWILIPCAWALRFLKAFSVLSFGRAMPAGYGLRAGILFCIVETILMLLLAIFWFSRWEGKKTEE
jgi:ABC-2 type transport system permease protein